MVIEVLFDVELEVNFFLGVLPAALMVEIGRHKSELLKLADGDAPTAPSRAIESQIEFQGRTYRVKFGRGKPYTGDDGRQVQELWILTVEAAS